MEVWLQARSIDARNEITTAIVTKYRIGNCMEKIRVVHGKGHEVSRVKSKVETEKVNESKKTQQKRRCHRSKEVSDLTVLDGNDIDALSP